jgi:hypothetical protein
MCSTINLNFVCLTIDFDRLQLIQERDERIWNKFMSYPLKRRVFHSCVVDRSDCVT